MNSNKKRGNQVETGPQKKKPKVVGEQKELSLLTNAIKVRLWGRERTGEKSRPREAFPSHEVGGPREKKVMRGKIINWFHYGNQMGRGGHRKRKRKAQYIGDTGKEIKIKAT